MNRRAFFGMVAAAASAGAFAAFPLHALAKSAPPDVYLAASQAHGSSELETWRHTVDHSWVRRVYFSPTIEYHDRHAMMAEVYARGRVR